MDPEEIRRRRKEKLLKREAKLDSQEAPLQESVPLSNAENPSLKSDEISQPIINEQANKQQENKDVIQEDKPKEEIKIDIKALYQLQQDHESFKKKVGMIRFLFAVLSGSWFYMFYHTFGVIGFSVYMFIFCDLYLITMLVYHEKKTYTRPIAHMIQLSKRSLNEQESVSEQPNQLDKAFGVMDLLMGNSAISKFSKLWTKIKYGRWLFEDVIFHIFGVMFIDSAIIFANKFA